MKQAEQKDIKSIIHDRFARFAVALLASAIAGGCGDNNKPEIEEEPPFVIKATIEKGGELAAQNVSIVSAVMYRDLDQTIGTTIADCEYKNGKFELSLPAVLDDIVIPPVTESVDEFMYPWISDLDAKMMYISLIGIKGQEKQGEFAFRNSNVEAAYCYCDRPFTIKGDEGYNQVELPRKIDVQFRKGWNVLYATVSEYSIFLSTEKPQNYSSLKWEYIDRTDPWGGGGSMEAYFDMRATAQGMKQSYNNLITKANIFDAVLTHDVENISGYEQIANFTFQPNNPKIYELFSKSYELILIANNIINPSGKVTVTQAEIREYTAEAIFIRAYVYSMLLNWFGGVPIVSDVVTPLRHNSAEEVRNYILADCNAVIAMAPASRIDLKHGALQLIERITLNEHFYNFSSLSEILDFPLYQSLMNSSVLVWGKDAISQGITTESYPEAMIKGSHIYPVRFAETILLKSEELMEMGDLADAVKYLNTIIAWHKDKYTPLPANASYEEIKAMSADLWHQELKNEGLTYAFLKRSNTFLDRLKQYGAKEHHKLLPFHPSVVNQSPNLTQNPGY
ncbi:MAG: RagB/SusD family nutrient uptake outer membrane protein [Tannerella sp.]|jgi:hypothetical protein|nr:RagB/SusD family nutrient uptake outer membrane protein [Tannerella sp.]